jgi:hypothetical protein
LPLYVDRKLGPIRPLELDLAALRGRGGHTQLDEDGLLRFRAALLCFHTAKQSARPNSELHSNGLNAVPEGALHRTGPEGFRNATVLTLTGGSPGFNGSPRSSDVRGRGAVLHAPQRTGRPPSRHAALPEAHTRTRLAAGGGDTTQAARRQRLPVLSICQPLALADRALNFADDESGYPDSSVANFCSLVNRR